MDCTILFQTPDYVVCIKPQGIESEHELPEQLAQQLAHTPVLPVHRLDRETGGVMVYAKHSRAAAHFAREIQTGRMKKQYYAVVQGAPQPEQGQMDDLLFRDRSRNKSYLVKRMRNGVKRAVLNYITKKQFEYEKQLLSLVQITLQTGRTHQIRVQFAGRTMPLFGDTRYGGPRAKGLALWAYEISFTDPDGQARCFRQLPSCQEPWCNWQLF